MAIAWDVVAGTPRHHGLGRLMYAAANLVLGEPKPEMPHASVSDIRHRLRDCMVDFVLARSSLRGSLPSELDAEMSAICEQYDEWKDRLFNGGRGKKGRGVAKALAERVLAVYVDIHRYDAVASHCESSS